MRSKAKRMGLYARNATRINVLLTAAIIVAAVVFWAARENMKPTGGELECIRLGGQWKPIRVVGGKNADGSEVNGYTRVELQRQMSDIGICTIPGLGAHLYSPGGYPFIEDTTGRVEPGVTPVVQVEFR